LLILTHKFAHDFHCDEMTLLLAHMNPQEPLVRFSIFPHQSKEIIK